MTETTADREAPKGVPADFERQQRLLSTPAANDAPPTGGPGRFTFFTAWRERRYAAGCCRELLRLHRTVAASRSGVSGEALYHLIVTAHVGGDSALAGTLLLRARESYALWPEPRALTFRDVVHYLAVSGYWAQQDGQRWMCTDVRRVIEATIPRHL